MDNGMEKRLAIIAACKRCVELGYFVGTWGNISVRWDDCLLITPTRVAYETMVPSDLVLVDMETGKVREGERLPSSEMQLHRAVYRARPDVEAVVHSHSNYASVVAALHEGIPCLLEDQAQLIGEVRCAPYVPGHKHMDLAAGAVAHLGQASAVLLANHGPVCCARSLDEAVLVNQVLEKCAAALLWSMARGQGVHPIPAEPAAAERYRYLYKYGKAADAEE